MQSIDAGSEPDFLMVNANFCYGDDKYSQAAYV
jgi:hypothetical protein